MSRRARVLIVIVAAVLTVPLSAQLVVTPTNTQGWQLTTSSGAGNVPPPAAYLAPGFETPPLGSGSLHLGVGQDGNDNAQARHPGYAGTLLSNLTALSYSTFTEVDGSGGQAPYLMLQIDNTGDGAADATLFFEPAYQTGSYPGDPVPNQGALVPDTWQTWDALAGGWWVGTGGPPLVTLATYVASNPTATIVNTASGLGGVRIVTGFGGGAWDNYLGAADNFTIGVSGVNTTYDFEAAAASVVTVTQPTPDGWTTQVVDDDTDTITTGSVTFVAGPGTPPMGDGSIQFTLGTEGEDGVQARQNGYDGQFIRDLNALTYSTYVQTPGSDTQAPYIILDVDLNNDGVRDDLWFFEPAYQTAGFCPSNPQPAVATGSWQTWDAANGCWYSLFGTAGTGPGVNVRPLSVLLDTEPDARLSTNIAGGSFRIVTGFGDLAWDNFVGNADALTVAFLGNTTTFDFEPVPAITIGDVALAEGSGGGTTNFVFTLTLSEAVSQSVTVEYTTADGTATAADGDYTPVVAPLTATFLPGTTSAQITIAVAADTKFELDETFFVNLANPQFATISDPQAQGTIQNDDLQPTISFVSDVTLAEGNGGGTTTFPFNVVLSNPSYLPITVDYTTTPGTATEGTDYADATGTLTFVAGDTAEVINVDVAADATFEPDETFTVDLANPTNATITDPQAIGTITNDDLQPAIGIDDVSLAEGDAGTTAFTFTVTLANPSSQTVTVDYTTNAGTATEGTDYTDNTGTLTFVAGDVSETVTVLVTGDELFEANETFTVDLSNVTNATLADPQGLGTILDDEGEPTILIGDVTQAEGNAGTTAFNFTVTLSHASATPVTVNYTTSPGTATEGVDYADATGTVTFVAGDVSETIGVNVTGDGVFEPAETFTVDLSAPAGATVGDTQGLGTITDDDGQPSILITDVLQAEGNGGTTPFAFTVTLSHPNATPVTVNYTTNPGTATEGTDYADATGTVTFVPGDVSEIITVNVTADTDFEPNETFFVDLSAPIGAAITDNQGLGTITNDDGPIADVSIAKTGPSSVAGETDFTYTITVNNAGPQTASNVVVTDVLPPALTFVSATPSQGTCSGTTTITCTLGAVASGGSATISLTVTAPRSGSFTNTATVANAPETDPTPGNNAGTTFAAVGSADIPTMSEWALIMLMAALMAMAVIKLK